MTVIAEHTRGAIVALLFKRVGDSLLATPALRALKRRYPDRDLAVLVEPQVARVFQNLPYINSVVVCTKSPNSLRLAQLARSSGVPSATVDFLSDPRSAWASLLSGAQLRVGFAVGLRKWFFTHHVEPQNAGNPVYSAAHKMLLAAQLGASSTDLFPDFVLNYSDEAFANEVWKKAGLPQHGTAALYISSRRSYKRWPLESFQQLVRRLRARNIENLLVVGSKAEELEMIAFAQTSDISLERVIACANLGELAAVLKQSTVFIGNDGGPKHLACAVGTATVTMFRNDPPEYWTPPDNPRHVAFVTVDESGVEEVAEATTRLFEAERA